MDIRDSKGMQRNNLVLIDFLNICFRYKHANKKNFMTEAINTIQSLGTSYGAKDIIILGDWGSYWRKDIYPEYKANRVALREKQTDKEKQDFMEFLDEAERTLITLKDMFQVFKFKGVEADDIAAYLAGHYADNYEHTWLISSDKDWDLLIKPNVSRFSYITRKEITWENWASHYDYEPHEHISVKVLQGDTGDNVPGVKGVGPKRAITLIDKYGSAMDIYDQLPLNGRYVYEQNLDKFGEQLLLNYELMDLETYCDEAIGQDNVNTIIESME